MRDTGEEKRALRDTLSHSPPSDLEVTDSPDWESLMVPVLNVTGELTVLDEDFY